MSATGDFWVGSAELIINMFVCFNRPQFLILASDGLWDTFSNEEAVAFIREHINEPHFGAKSITLQVNINLHFRAQTVEFNLCYFVMCNFSHTLEDRLTTSRQSSSCSRMEYIKLDHQKMIENETC